jgi:hypothetical protein
MLVVVFEARFDNIEGLIHSSDYLAHSGWNSGGWAGRMLSTFPQPKMNIP